VPRALRGQYIDIWTSEHDTEMTVDLYYDMIGRKTAALISATSRRGPCSRQTMRP